jgi:hypothetical protein
LSVFVLGIGPF